MSFGVTDDDESSREYKKALEKVISENTDMVFIAAAGNDSADLNENPQYPANFLLKNVITVASIDASGELSDFSNYNNSFVDIAARGSDILSQWPYGPPIELSGTSMAAPQVTRVCGRVQHKKPEWSAKQIVEHILKTSTMDAQLTEFVSSGRVLNEDQAIKALNLTAFF
jgi:subtilisin family serine protease